jgi:hypothetical protein
MKDARGWLIDGAICSATQDGDRWDVDILIPGAVDSVSMGKVYSAPIEGYWYGAKVVTISEIRKEVRRRKSE